MLVVNVSYAMSAAELLLEGTETYLISIQQSFPSLDEPLTDDVLILCYRIRIFVKCVRNVTIEVGYEVA